jgi:hypothetical protein
MPIPDAVVFGPSPDGTPCTYGDVRAMNSSERLGALKRRLDSWLIAQTRELARDEHQDTKVDSPFPLAVMTCVACEVAGQVFYGAHNREAEGTQRDCFIAVARAVHKQFSRQLTQKFRQHLANRWPNLDLHDCTTIAHLIYRSFRNSLIHAYQGIAVYLTADETDSFRLDDGFLILNPYWFWEAFCTRYNALWNGVEHAQENNPRRASCLAYIDELLE